MRLLAIFCLSVLVASCVARPDPLARDFLRFLDWFPGRYDNALQVQQERADGVDSAYRNYRRHSIFRRVDLPAFGPAVFYAQQFRDGDPEKIYRQRIYVMSLDRERQAIRLRVHLPNDTDSIVDAYREPAKLADLTPAQTIVWSGCDVFWQAQSDRFVGKLDPGACQFDSEAFGQRIQLDETLTLFADAMWFADRGLSLDGEYLFGMRGDQPAKALRARAFRCTDQRGQSWWMHDQGGSHLWESARKTRHPLTLQGEGDRLRLAVGEHAKTGGSHSIAINFDSDRIVCNLDSTALFSDRP